MHLENLVFDAVEPRRLGRFWEAVLGCERLTDEPGIFETRLAIEGGPTLDLCFQPVPSPPTEPARVHLDLVSAPAEAFGGQGDGNLPPERRLADPEGNLFSVATSPPADAGPMAAISLDSADPARDSGFWAWLTGWSHLGDRSLRHPSLRGPLLTFRQESAPKSEAKNRLHLDARLEAGEDAEVIEAEIARRGGRRLHPGWGDLPWRSYLDPSGNEFCVLPARGR